MPRVQSLVVSAFDLLTEQQRKLVTTYLETGSKEQAKIAAGLNYGRDPFKSAMVRRAVNEGMRPAFDKAGLSFEKHLEYVASIAYGDPSEIVEIIKVNCRYCHGVAHEYQFKDSEYADLLEKDMKEFMSNHNITGRASKSTLIDEYGYKPLPTKGGLGFDGMAEPDPMCPECSGEGQERLIVQPSAVSHPLFGGVSYDKNHNLVVKFRNQDAALDHVSRLLGFLIDKTEVTIVDHVTKINEARKRSGIKASEKVLAAKAAAKKVNDE